MRPVLFRWRGHAIPSYPAMLYLGMVVGLATGNIAAHAIGLNAGRVYLASVLLLPVALLGARLASVIGNPVAYRDEPARIWRRTEGGQAMYGGLIAVPASIPLLAVLRVPFWAFWDAATFTMLTGMVFARIGCLLNGCCGGRPTSSRFGLVLPDHSGARTRRIPTQILEAGLGATLLGGAVALASVNPPSGLVFTGALAVYALARLFLQPLREHQGRLAGVPMLRAVSAGLLLLTLLLTIPRLV